PLGDLPPWVKYNVLLLPWSLWVQTAVVSWVLPNVFRALVVSPVWYWVVLLPDLPGTAAAFWSQVYMLLLGAVDNMLSTVLTTLTNVYFQAVGGVFDRYMTLLTFLYQTDFQLSSSSGNGRVQEKFACKLLSLQLAPKIFSNHYIPPLSHSISWPLHKSAGAMITLPEQLFTTEETYGRLLFRQQVTVSPCRPPATSGQPRDEPYAYHLDLMPCPTGCHTLRHHDQAGVKSSRGGSGAQSLMYDTPALTLPFFFSTHSSPSSFLFHFRSNALHVPASDSDLHDVIGLCFPAAL
ncbi:hypothetical protein CRENBAI_002780, partial [Crenichthys baileyi]